MLDVDPIPRAKTLADRLNGGITGQEKPLPESAAYHYRGRRRYVKRLCQGCGGTGVKSSTNCFCELCNALGYVEDEVEVPVEEE